MVFAFPPLVIGTYSLESVGHGNTWKGSSSTVVSPAAGFCWFIPFRLSAPFIVRRMFVFNGTPAGSVDLGIYDRARVLLVSTGSTANSGSSALQYIDVDDTVIGPGLFYFGMSVESGSITLVQFNYANNRRLRAMGCAQQESTFPLPATATMSAYLENYLPLIGMTGYAA